MKRQPTPDILGALLGGSPIAPPTPLPPAVPAPVAVTPTAITDRGSELPPTLYRLAGQLRSLADDHGVLWIAHEDAAKVFGTALERTQANQLSSLKRAHVVSYSRDDGWFVRFLVVQSRTESVQSRTESVQSRTTDDNDGSAIPHDIRAIPHDGQNGSAIPHDFRAIPHDGQDGVVQSRTISVQSRTESVQSRTNLDTTTNTVCMIVGSDTNNQSNNAPAPEPEPEPPFVPDPAEIDTAKRLLVDIGVIPVTANLIVARRSLYDVRRVVGYGWANRREVGGNLDNWLGFVVKALSFPDRHGIPAAISPNFLHSDLHLHHLTPAELAEYEADMDLEPKPLPDLVRVADEDAQVAPSDDAPAGLDPGQVWREFAAGQGPDFAGTRLASYDPDTGVAVIVAPVTGLDWLRQRGTIVVRKRAVGFGRPVFAEFVTKEEI